MGAFTPIHALALNPGLPQSGAATRSFFSHTVLRWLGHAELQRDRSFKRRT
jgi:hypothetical protein